MTLVDDTADPDTGEFEEFPVARRSRRRLVLGILGGFGLVVIIAGFLAFRYVDRKISPSGPEGAEVQVTIPLGSSRDGIATILKQAGVIDNTTVFSWYVR